MSRSKGKRYDTEAKLNIKKVIAVIIAILVIIMFVIGIRELLKEKENIKEKTFITAYYPIFENGKWGVIDTKQSIIIEPTYDEMIIKKSYIQIMIKSKYYIIMIKIITYGMKQEC